MNGNRIENVKMTKHRKNSSFFHSAQMMVATECWLGHTKTVVKRMAGSITPNAKDKVARMMSNLEDNLRMVENGCCGVFARAGPAGTAAAGQVLSHVPETIKNVNGAA